MNHDFNDLAETAAGTFGKAFVRRSGRAFSLVSGEGTVSFAALASDPALAIVRTRILDIGSMAGKGAMALDALEGNFFWSGTGGGTLSVGEDGGLWLTERRPVEELAAPGGLEACLGSFARTASLWRERGALHG